MRAFYKLTLFTWLLISFLGVRQSSASHLAGGNITYTNTSGNTYHVVFTLYRDCKGIAAPSSLTVNIVSASCGYSITTTATAVPGTGQLVNPPCPGTLTACNGGPAPGIQRWQYYIDYTLPARCSDWRFSYSLNARNAAITTLQTASTYNMYVEATLNNLTVTGNSSVNFTNDPILFVCLNQPYCFSPGAVDINGDSLSYSFIAPRSDVNLTIPYVSGFSVTNPISSSPPVTINSSTGLICMTPTRIEVGVIVVKINEYRNGVLVGTTMRDMQVYTQTCNNALPVLSGIDSALTHTVNICAGASKCFKVFSGDADANQWLRDSLINTSGLSISFDTTNFHVINGTHAPIAQLCVTTSAADLGKTFNFSIFVRDNFCPTNGSNLANYSIVVGGLQTTSSTSPESCTGSNNGSATVSVTNGSGSYTYLWSAGGQTNATATGLAAGTYSVTVNDASGCNGVASVTVALGAALTGTTSSTAVGCNGGRNGTATANVTNGTGPYQYLWTPSQQTSQTATGLGAGSYSAFVTDAHGCTVTLNVTVTQPTVLSVAITNLVTPTCAALGSFTISPNGGTPNYTYFTNTNPVQTTATVTNLAAGSYVITIRDANGCRASTSLTVTGGGSLMSSSSHTNVDCNGNANGSISTSTTGGVGNYVYSWTPNVSSGPTASGLGSGAYTVNISDNGGCTSTITVTITEPTPLVVSSTSSPILCNGQTSTIVVSASGGTPSYNGTGSFVVNAGPYNYPVTDAHGCSSSASGVVNQPSALNVSSSSGTILCNGGTTTVTVNPTGGTSPYNGGGSFTVTGGSYAYIVTDANGCTSSSTIVVSQPTALVVTETHTDITGCECTGFLPGSITIHATGGTGAYTYTWTPPVNNGPSASGLPAGSYTVVVSDANNCTASVTAVIAQSTVMTLSFTHTDVTCEGAQDGSATVIVSGGTGPFSYIWLPSGSTNATASNLAAGSYFVRVKDVNGCPVFNNVNIGFQHPQPILNLGNDTTTCSSKPLTLNAGSGFASYLWTNGSTSPSIVVTASGSYGVTVTDTYGCTNTDVITVTVVACAFGNSNNQGAHAESITDKLAAMVYPNPAKNTLYVAVNGVRNEIAIKMELADMLGNKVYTNTEKSDVDYLGHINLENLASGIYFLKIQFANQVKTVKVVKE